MSRPSKFPPEFRARGVQLYRDSEGRTIAEVARELGVGAETFRNLRAYEWLDDFAGLGQRDQVDRESAPAGSPKKISSCWRVTASQLNCASARALAATAFRASSGALSSA
jgi:transposase-like protein